MTNTLDSSPTISTEIKPSISDLSSSISTEIKPSILDSASAISSEIKPSEKCGKLYVMYNPLFEFYGENVYKIGKSKNIEKRLMTYCTSYIDPPEFKYVSELVSDCGIAERLVFSELDQFRIRKNREFFKCDLGVIISSIKGVAEYMSTQKVNISHNQQTDKLEHIETQETAEKYKIKSKPIMCDRELIREIIAEQLAEQRTSSGPIEKFFKRGGVKENNTVCSVNFFVEKNIRPSDEEDSYITMVELWNLYKKSDNFIKSMKKKTLKSLMVKNLGVQCYDRAKIRGIGIKSHFKGYKIIGIQSKELQL